MNTSFHVPSSTSNMNQEKSWSSSVIRKLKLWSGPLFPHLCVAGDRSQRRFSSVISPDYSSGTSR